MPVEFTARAFAAHLLDAGFSPDHLYRWIEAIGPDLNSINELAEAASDMVSRMPVQTYEIFVPCAAPYHKPDARSGSTFRWATGHDAAVWLRERVPSGEGRHQVAADRLAALITCSLPRAELTPLAYQHMESGIDDTLARSLRATSTNYDKVQLVEQHLRSGLASLLD